MLHQNLLSNHFRRELIISRQELDMFGSVQQDLKLLLSAHGLKMFSGIILRSLGMIMTVPIFHLQIGTMLPTAIYGSGGASLHLRYLIKEEEFVRDTILLEITSEYLYKYISYYVYSTIQQSFSRHYWLADGFFKGFLWITKHTTVASPQPVELLAFEVSSV